MNIPIDTRLGFCRDHADTAPSTIALEDFIQMIRDPELRIQNCVAYTKISYLEAGEGKPGKAAAKQFKGMLPCVTLSATGTRTEPDVATGLVNVDFDELGPSLEDVRAKLNADPHVVSAFISPSGNGLKLALRVPVIPHGPAEEMRAQHQKHFEAMVNYCQNKFGISPDKSTSDLMRLCYVSHDPNCSFNPEALELDVEKWAFQEKDVPSKAASRAKKDSRKAKERLSPIHVVEAMLKSIPARPEYKDWVSISAAVRNSMGNNTVAIDMLKRWSPEEEEGEYAKLLSSAFSDISFGSLHHHAGEHGFDGVVSSFFYAGRVGFSMLGSDGFVPLTSENPVIQHLRQDYRIPTDRVTELVCRIRTEQYVKHIGSIAGHQEGLHEFNGDKFLVTRGPKIIEGKEGGSNFVYPFFWSLLGDESHPDQFTSFLCWLAHCRKAVKEGKRRQTPALALTGAIANGKTLGIEIVKRCLGGRAEKAYKYFSGDEKFNSELAWAELLICDDDVVSSAAAQTKVNGHSVSCLLSHVCLPSNTPSGLISPNGRHIEAAIQVGGRVRLATLAFTFSPTRMAASTWLSENFQQRIYREAVEHLKDALAPCVADEQELTDLMEEVIDAQQQGQPDKAVELLKNRAGAALWPSIEPYWVHLQDASTFNIRATPQMRRWLFEVKKLTPVKSTNAKEKGFPSIPWERVENLPPEVQKQYQPSTDKQTLKILGQGDATIQVRAAK